MGPQPFSRGNLLPQLQAFNRAIQRACSVLLALVGIGVIYLTADIGGFRFVLCLPRLCGPLALRRVLAPQPIQSQVVCTQVFPAL